MCFILCLQIHPSDMHKYGEVRERDFRGIRRTPILGTHGGRQQHVYTSTHNQIELQLTNMTEGNFLILYEGTTTLCQPNRMELVVLWV